MNSQRLSYIVAGFGLDVAMPAAWVAARLLPTFAPFAADAATAAVATPLLSATVLPLTARPEGFDGEVVDETTNDAGHVRLRRCAANSAASQAASQAASAPDPAYAVELHYDGPSHFMLATAAFDRLTIWLAPHATAAAALSSLLRIAYAQAILPHDALSLHASCVGVGGRAYLFMGRSGTGKSTHAALWLRHVAGAQLVNDDNPTLRLLPGGRVVAAGTPWSGKTPCYRPVQLPVGGMVRLSQAPANAFTPVGGAQAFVAIFPGCSVVGSDERLRAALYDVVARLAAAVPVGLLACRPDAEAARLCHEALTSRNETE